MKISEIKLIIIVLIFILIFILIKEYFTIKSITVNYYPNYLFPDGTTVVQVDVDGVNRFGFRVPLINPKIDFYIEEGSELIEILSKSSTSIVVKSKYELGKVVISIQNNYSLFPIKIEIPIIKQIT